MTRASVVIPAHAPAVVRGCDVVFHLADAGIPACRGIMAAHQDRVIDALRTSAEVRS